MQGFSPFIKRKITGRGDRDASNREEVSKKFILNFPPRSREDGREIRDEGGRGRDGDRKKEREKRRREREGEERRVFFLILFSSFRFHIFFFLPFIPPLLPHLLYHLVFTSSASHILFPLLPPLLLHHHILIHFFLFFLHFFSLLPFFSLFLLFFSSRFLIPSQHASRDSLARIRKLTLDL